ncbi:hypothetical protein CBD41_04120 [bacterium TMED181]|nr:hypothetical protein [Planctomycetota bacterium]OUW45313.1 MAG: hypothetical protein CBD41_04120 [bacterium TMED181]
MEERVGGGSPLDQLFCCRRGRTDPEVRSSSTELTSKCIGWFELILAFDDSWTCRSPRQTGEKVVARKMTMDDIRFL